MQIIFIENSIDFTSSSLNYKAIDFRQKNLIHFAEELAKKGHLITVYNATIEEKKENGVKWFPLDSIRNDIIKTDILIACDELELLNLNIKAKVKFFWLNSFLDKDYQKEVLITLIKKKYIILYNNQIIIENLQVHFNYVPKICLGMGVHEDFFNVKKNNFTKCAALITSHPLRGLDWMLEVWKNIINVKVPWAELHIYSQYLANKNFSKNVKINNLKLKLFKYKNEGIFVKKPLIEVEYIKALQN